MNGTDMTHRLRIPDMVKGIAIIGVVLTHLYLTPVTGGEASSETPTVPLELVYLTLITFFVISGYFYRPRGFMYNMKRRIVQLATVMVVCTLVLPIPMYAYLCTLGYRMDFVSGYMRCLIALIGNYVVLTPMHAPHAYDPLVFDTTVGYYFINLMVFSFAVFYAVAERALADRRTMAVTVTACVLATVAVCEVSPIHLPFQIELVPISVAFMLFGAYLGRKRFLESLELRGLRDRRFWAILLVSLAVALVTVTVFPVGRGFHYAYFGEYGGWSAIPYFVAGCSTSIMVFALSLILSKMPGLSDIVSFLGTHTLAILLLHTFIGKLLGFALSDTVGINGCPVLSVPEALFVIPLTLAVTAIIGKYAPKVHGKLKKLV
ncbi:MAG: acyltransferase [archaeon]|nr:acyltransferase [archaeon]